jgi:diguanylate cyclase (GGDEF)-like protein
MTSEQMSIHFEPLELAVQGAPIDRTLNSLANLISRLHSSSRCAIFLLENERLWLAAERNLQSNDRALMSSAPAQSPLHFLENLTKCTSVHVKSFVTSTAELIGALVVFGLDSPEAEEAIGNELDKICWMATLAIEQKHLSEELSYRAHHDPLTHLWSRVWMEEEIDRVLSSGNRVRLGLAVLGIDRFRVINDVLGYQLGNELLRQIAGRIARVLDPAYSLARGGGDEFMILMTDLNSPDDINDVAQTLLTCFDETFKIGDHELVVRASIGSAFAASDECSADGLESQAYTALRHVKKRARGKIAAFTVSMISIPPERLVMEQHLRFALQKREFELYYQPQVDIRSGMLVGVEALLRWNHPALGFISPGVFIPLAEEIGIIEEIGDWVLEEAMKQLAEWQKMGLRIRIAVNVSALQFLRADFGASVAKKLRRAQISPSDLELEITESFVMTNFEHGLRQMKILRSLGVALAVDDFGTGHSSLAYLQRLPIDRLKIDRMFIKEITSREDHPTLLASIVQMAHALGLAVVAEGVETAEQMTAVKSLNCEEVQGYFFSKPLPAKHLLEWSRNNTPVRLMAS